jgi:hypothetical protein
MPKPGVGVHPSVVETLEMMRITVAIAAILLLAACATSNPGTGQPAPAAVDATADAPRPGTLAARNDGEDLVCVNERVTGSRHPKKVCYSSAGYQALKETGQGATRDLQRMPNQPRIE